MDASSIAGTWTGEWQSKNKHQGIWEFSINSDGKLSGTTSDHTEGSQGQITGRIEGPGVLSYEYRYGNRFFASRATFSLTPEGLLSMDYTDSQNGVRFSEGKSLMVRVDQKPVGSSV